MTDGFFRRFYNIIVLLLGLWLGFEIVSHLVAEILWFREVGYLPTFLLRLKTQLGLWAIALCSAGFLLFNLALAHRLGDRKAEEQGRQGRIPTQNSGLGLRWLLPVVLVLSLLAGLIVFHYGNVAFSYWRPDLTFASVLPPLPPRFAPESIWRMWASPQIWQLGLVLGLAIAIIIKPQFLLNVIALLISLSFGLVLSGQWAKVLQYFHPTVFNSKDPLFNRDISFYVFTLPVWELLEFWLVGLLLYGLVAVALSYLLSGNSISEGRFPGFTHPQLRHLYGLGSGVMLSLALSYWLRRYELLYSIRGVVYGASYTDVTVLLPIYTLLSLVALAIAVFLLWQTIFSFEGRTKKTERKTTNLYFILYTSSFILFFCLFIFSFILPEVVQKLVVQPNEVARESRYIQRSIALTREAFEIDKIEVKTFNPEGGLTITDIRRNDLTIRNIRLWDARPLLQTNRQLQQIRPYYKFPSADIDRYTLITQTPEQTEKRQVILAARELDYSAVPQEAKTWVNEHLVYTHGYGFTMSPVNTVVPGGLPAYFVKDIGADPEDRDGGTLQTSSQQIRYSIPIGNPRIYYGEIADTYVMTGAKIKELDYPSGDENVYNTYDGFGGIKIDSRWRRWVFAKYLNDWQMLLTGNFTNQSKLLFRRNINERVRAIAPFLRYDSSPYLVVTKVPTENKTKNNEQNYLYWIIDAYTTSDRYPYSDPGKNKFNYIRNSVKVAIDAYNGDVNFYVSYPQDPIIKTWSAIFPRAFKPLSAMPDALRTHLRYPLDFYSVQSERLLAYHMTDYRVFYNREDLWKISNEIYDGKAQQVEPYYLIMKLPTAKKEEFILLLPFTPVERSNLIAWLAGRSDGEEYGKLLLYQFPKQQLVYGPEQLEALINQDPVISRQITLWNREGSRAIQGNLLVIPIERSLLYVEPLYLEAEQNSLPTLVRVIVAYENRIVMAETLEQALRAIFQSEQPESTPIVRPVEPVD